MPKCKECGWFRPIEDKSGKFNGGEKGRCLGRAPTATAVVMPVMNQITREVTPQIIEVTLWPTVGAACDACGDFLKAPVKPQDAPGSIKLADRGQGGLEG